MNKSNLWKLIIVTCLILVTFNLIIDAAFAATASPSATEVERAVIERIKNNLDNAQQNIQQQTLTNQIRAFVGTIESVSAKAITIKTINGVKQAEISESTSLTSDGKANVKLTDLPVGNSIIAIGRSADNQTQATIKVIVSAAPTPDERIVTTASVTATDPTAKTISLSSDRFTDKARLSTRLMLMYDSVLNKITLDKINEGDKLFVVVHQLDSGPVLTRLINLSSTAPTSTPTPAKKADASKAVCGDKICQSSETPETCPTDCQQ